jgi:hypothetical protein
MSEKLKAILAELRARFEEIYGDRNLSASTSSMTRFNKVGNAHPSI